MSVSPWIHSIAVAITPHGTECFCRTPLSVTALSSAAMPAPQGLKYLATMRRDLATLLAVIVHLRASK